MRIIKQLRDDELKIVAEFIRDNIFVPSFSKKRTVFLCGGNLKVKHTGRYKMAKILEDKTHYELIYPENLFEDLLTGPGQHNLLILENILADSVDAIIVFPESSGSFAELGAFSSNSQLACKMICIRQKKHSRDKSFINYGPIKLIKASDTGKVLDINYNNLEVEDKKQKIYRRINTAISAIKKAHPIRKDTSNILEIENFILPSIYLIDLISTKTLYKLVQFTTGHDKKFTDIATRSSISNLINNNCIIKTNAGYEITQKGIEKIKSSMKSLNLDIARIEILNSQHRKNTIIKATNF